MKEAVGGASLFFIVLTIMTVFGVYISITINWSNAYKVKDEILFYIEKNKGMNEETIRDIRAYTKKRGYSSVGACPENSCWRGFNINGTNPKGVAQNNKSANFCVRRYSYEKTNTNLNQSYYAVKVFFSLDVPIISRFRITIDGETAPINNPREIILTNTDCKVN